MKPENGEEVEIMSIITLKHRGNWSILLTLFHQLLAIGVVSVAFQSIGPRWLETRSLFSDGKETPGSSKLFGHLWTILCYSLQYIVTNCTLICTAPGFRESALFSFYSILFWCL